MRYVVILLMVISICILFMTKHKGEAMVEDFKPGKVRVYEVASGKYLLVDRIIKFYKTNAKPRQRFSLLIEETGKDRFVKEVVV